MAGGSGAEEGFLGATGKCLSTEAGSVWSKSQTRALRCIWLKALGSQVGLHSDIYPGLRKSKCYCSYSEMPCPDRWQRPCISDYGLARGTPPGTPFWGQGEACLLLHVRVLGLRALGCILNYFLSFLTRLAVLISYLVKLS